MGVDGSDDVAERLTALILAACSEVVGPALASSVLALPKERVRASPRATAGGCDFQCHAPVTVFRKLEAVTRRDAVDADTADTSSTPSMSSSPDEPGTMRASRRPDGAIEVVVVSSFGVARHRTYADATRLADAVIQAMDPRALSELIADVRVELPSDATRTAVPKKAGDEPLSARKAKRARSTKDGGVGSISLLTKRRMLENGAQGLLLCRQCGYMFAGDKGLQLHQQVKHGNTYQASKAAIADSRMVLVATSIAQLEHDTNPRTTVKRSAKSNTAQLAPGLAAARDGNLASLRAMVESKSMDPGTEVDKHGSDALHWAAGSGHLDVCVYLVDECGVPAGRAQVRDGRNAMHWAARNGRTDVCEWLWRERGVSVDAATKDGTTPFHWAVWQGRLDTCAWLVNVGKCDWRALNSFGCNAAQWAAQSGDVAMCDWLNRLGLDMTLLNNNGHSAVHKAAVKGQRETCEWLLTAGGLGAEHVRPDYHDGMTPAEMARLEGHDDLATWLREREDEFKRHG